jgi:hypothetical protein
VVAPLAPAEGLPPVSLALPPIDGAPPLPEEGVPPAVLLEPPLAVEPPFAVEPPVVLLAPPLCVDGVPPVVLVEPPLTVDEVPPLPIEGMPPVVLAGDPPLPVAVPLSEPQAATNRASTNAGKTLSCISLSGNAVRRRQAASRERRTIRSSDDSTNVTDWTHRAVRQRNFHEVKIDLHADCFRISRSFRRDCVNALSPSRTGDCTRCKLIGESILLNCCAARAS